MWGKNKKPRRRRYHSGINIQKKNERRVEDAGDDVIDEV